MNPINTIPIQLFVKQVKSSEATQQKEVRLTINDARALALCLTEVSAKLLENYNNLLVDLLATQGNSDVSIQMDGGAL